MTREETKKLLAVIRAAYPNFHKDPYGAAKTDAEWSAVIDIWAIAMSDFEYGYIANGFKKLVQTHKFPPTPADVIEVAYNAAIDWLDVASIKRYGGMELPDDMWMIDQNRRPIQVGQWQAERLKLQEAQNAGTQQTLPHGLHGGDE